MTTRLSVTQREREQRKLQLLQRAEQAPPRKLRAVLGPEIRKDEIARAVAAALVTITSLVRGVRLLVEAQPARSANDGAKPAPYVLIVNGDAAALTATSTSRIIRANRLGSVGGKRDRACLRDELLE